MSLRLPSLQALLVFETSARLLSFTKAAGELNVTPVAVSRMVARLEDALGFRLFERTKLGLALTERGATLQRAVASGFGQIGTTIDELKRDHAQGETVTLSLASGFAALWLLPRYAGFQKAFPSVNLRLQVMAGRLYGPLEDADLGIRLHGAGSDKHPHCLCPEIIVPVCSPGYRAEFGPLDKPSHVDGHTLVHLDPTTHSWADFYRVTGLGDAGAARRCITPIRGWPCNARCSGKESCSGGCWRLLLRSMKGRSCRRGIGMWLPGAITCWNGGRPRLPRACDVWPNGSWRR